MIYRCHGIRRNFESYAGSIIDLVEPSDHPNRLPVQLRTSDPTLIAAIKVGTLIEIHQVEEDKP